MQLQAILGGSCRYARFRAPNGYSDSGRRIGVGRGRALVAASRIASAKARAEQMAQQGGRKIKQLRSARMGVFQITPPHSTETNWDGINDKTTVEKSVRATVNASFLLE